MNTITRVCFLHLLTVLFSYASIGKAADAYAPATKEMRKKLIGTWASTFEATFFLVTIRETHDGQIFVQGFEFSDDPEVEYEKIQISNISLADNALSFSWGKDIWHFSKISNSKLQGKIKFENGFSLDPAGLSKLTRSKFRELVEEMIFVE